MICGNARIARHYGARNERKIREGESLSLSKGVLALPSHAIESREVDLDRLKNVRNCPPILRKPLRSAQSRRVERDDGALGRRRGRRSRGGGRRRDWPRRARRRMRLKRRAHILFLYFGAAALFGVGGERFKLQAVLRNQPTRQWRHADAFSGPRLTESVKRRRDFLEGRARRRSGGRWRSLGWRRSGGCGLVADDSDDCANLRHRPRLNPNFIEPASDGRLHFQRHLVGFNLKEIVAFPHLIANRFEPVEDFSLGDGLAELRHDDRMHHRSNRS